MRRLERTTKAGNKYMIEYRLCGLFKWEWDVCLYSPDPRGDWLGLTFGWERTLFPRRAMRKVLEWYSEYKDGDARR